MISIIIPAYEEEGRIGKLIHYLTSKAAHPAITEILVVDGGSRDRTVHEAEQTGARVVVAPRKGRARQMNEGADQARGAILYFLHADTFPPVTFADDILSEISRKNYFGGFRLTFDDSHVMLRLYGWFTRFDVNAFRYGDQSIFMTKELFVQTGGFDESLIVMEDNELVRRINKHAGYTIIPKNVTTSARKYRENGIIRLQLVFMLIYLMYNLGAGQERLVRVYKALIKG